MLAKTQGFYGNLFLNEFKSFTQNKFILRNFKIIHINCELIRKVQQYQYKEHLPKSIQSRRSNFDKFIMRKK